MKPLLLLLSLLLLSACGGMKMILPISDASENVPRTSRCTPSVPQAGTMTFQEINLEGTFTPAVVAVPAGGYAQTTFTPAVTGRSRGGTIACDFAYVDNKGNAKIQDAKKAVIVRDAKKPTAMIDIPGDDADAPTKPVGTAFDVTVDVTDTAAGGMLGVPSGIDYLFVEANGPLAPASMIIQAAGVFQGPPTDANGPTMYDTPFQLTCTAEGDGRVRIRAWDAAGSYIDSNWHNVACVDP